MLDGISQGVRFFIDEIRIQPFAVENSLSRNVPSILVSLRDPGAHTGGECARIEPKMAASAKVLAGSQDRPINLIFRTCQKPASPAVQPEDGQAT
jgi:hypothetical protein